MLNNSSINALTSKLEEFFQFQQSYIFDRPNLGDLNFEGIRSEYDVIYRLLDRLRKKDYSLIFENQATDLFNRITSLLEIMNLIRHFNITEANKINDRSDLINRFKDQIYNIAVVLGPTLAYLDIVDPPPNTDEKFRALFEEFEKYTNDKRKKADELYTELSDTLDAAKNASATIGSIQFSKLFDKKSSDQRNSAEN